MLIKVSHLYYTGRDCTNISKIDSKEVSHESFIYWALSNMAMSYCS